MVALADVGSQIGNMRSDIQTINRESLKKRSAKAGDLFRKRSKGYMAKKEQRRSETRIRVVCENLSRTTRRL
jgi:hypothetical protein